MPKRKTHTLVSYIPPHIRLRESYIKKEKNHRLKYKTQKTMPNHNHRSKYKTQNKMRNHAQVPEICCSFLPSREIRHINTPAGKPINLSSETPTQEVVKEDDNKNN